ncbi:hypothetical protein ACQEVF_32475 [Nonomuraea polychroma]|uniref:hypothetical protein n=1 Tax=Nonomuraea polychroma TaxID=46176 RepID=UPI003D900D2B
MATKPRDEQMIAALKRERATYASRGDDDRVKQVDEQLKHYGYEGTQDPDPGAGAEPRGRRTRAQQTASASSPSDKADTGKESTSSKTTTGKSSA